MEAKGFILLINEWVQTNSKRSSTLFICKYYPHSANTKPLSDHSCLACRGTDSLSCFCRMLRYLSWTQSHVRGQGEHSHRAQYRTSRSQLRTRDPSQWPLPPCQGTLYAICTQSKIYSSYPIWQRKNSARDSSETQGRTSRTSSLWKASDFATPSQQHSVFNVILYLHSTLSLDSDPV